MTEPATSAAEAAALLASGSVSSVELTEAYLARIERLNPILHAVIATAPDATEALRRAAPRIAAPGPMRAGNRTRLPASAIGADLRSALASLVVTRSAPRAPRVASQFDEALWRRSIQSNFLASTAR